LVGRPDHLPPGYEDRLLHSVMQQIALQKAPVSAATRSSSFNMFGFLGSLRGSLLWSGAFATVLLLLWVGSSPWNWLRQNSESAPADFLTHTAKQVDPYAVERWLDGVGVASSIQDRGGLGFSAVVEDLRKDSSSVAQRALDQVAASFGMSM
jgi:hypothetical protein